MKYIALLLFTCTTLLCLAQAETEPEYTLNPTSSRLIGGYFALGGGIVFGDDRTSNNSHFTRIGPYFSLTRTAKKDILLVTELLLSIGSNSDQSATNARLLATIGIDWRHELYSYNKIKVFGSFGPRLGVNYTAFDGEATLAYNVGVNGKATLAYEMTPNIRLLTNVINGDLSYNTFSETSSTFNYNIRNTLLSPNFSVEYIFPLKS